jgi:putative acetyltransferase
MPPTYQLVEADTTARYEAARALIEEYAAQIGESMGVDLCFQDLSSELERLPLMYGRPSGFMLLAGRDEEWVACGALRRFSDQACEVKRLYVKSAARGANLGRLMAERLIAQARTLGYRKMVLDTLADMIAARALYRSLGFRETTPYYPNPLAGVSYMELDLGTAPAVEPRS